MSLEITGQNALYFYSYLTFLVHILIFGLITLTFFFRNYNKSPHESTWTPVLWALKLIQRARNEGKITIEAPVYANLVSSFEYIEHSNRVILNYGWVNFPLAYTQVLNSQYFNDLVEKTSLGQS